MEGCRGGGVVGSCRGEGGFMGVCRGEGEPSSDGFNSFMSLLPS